jgi:hypothetical protein
MIGVKINCVLSFCGYTYIHTYGKKRDVQRGEGVKKGREERKMVVFKYFLKVGSAITNCAGGGKVQKD